MCCWSVKLDVVQTFWNLCRGCGKGAGVLKKGAGAGLAGRFIWGRNSGVEIWEVGIWEVVAPRGVWWRVGFSLYFV